MSNINRWWINTILAIFFCALLFTVPSYAHSTAILEGNNDEALFNISNIKQSKTSRRSHDQIETSKYSHKGEIENFQIPFSGFITNKGQIANSNAQFYFTTDSSSIRFDTSVINIRQKIKTDKLSIQNPSDSFLEFNITFLQSNTVDPVGVLPKSHETNYFYGKNQYTDIISYDEVWYYDIYPQIDMRYYMSEKGLKYEFIVRPGGDPNSILTKISETASIEILPTQISYFDYVENQNYNLEKPVIIDGNLDVFTQKLHSKSTIFESTDIGSYKGEPVEASFRAVDLDKQVFGYEIAEYDSTRVLIIDPYLLGFSTYIGGNNIDYSRDIAVDNNGDIYIVGSTYSTDFPTKTGSYDESHNGGTLDVFITKLSADGVRLVYSTYIGGSGNDETNEIVVDNNGNAYV
ncbi:MAG: DUF7948 domain-containing protein, partial [Candidatus Kariarchaeaceae archaeon]